MAKVLVLYYSSYGHIETMAKAVAAGPASRRHRRYPAGARTGAGESEASHYKLDQDAPLATVDELAGYDAIIVGSGTRYGRMTSQMANFWDQTGGLWFQGKLVGKVGAAFTSTASQHGGQETTLLNIMTGLLHHGMVIVGLPYAFQGQLSSTR